MAKVVILAVFVIVGVASIVVYDLKNKETLRVIDILMAEDPLVIRFLKAMNDFEDNYSSLRKMGATMPYRFDIKCESLDDFKRKVFWGIEEAIDWIKASGYEISGYAFDKEAYASSFRKSKFCKAEYDEIVREIRSYETPVKVEKVKYGLKVQEICRDLLIKISWRWTGVSPLPIAVAFFLEYTPESGKPLKEIRSFMVEDLLKEGIEK